MPVEEYLRLTGKPYRECRDGVLYSKAIPAKVHSLILRVLAKLLANELPKARPVGSSIRASAWRGTILARASHPAVLTGFPKAKLKFRSMSCSPRWSNSVCSRLVVSSPEEASR